MHLGYEAVSESDTLRRIYQRLYDLSGGVITPLVGDSLVSLGYGPPLGCATAAPAGDQSSDTLRGGDTLHRAAPPWPEALVWEADTLTSREPITLDVGAAGKGHLIDLVSEVLVEQGANDHVVDASGDLRHRGSGNEDRPTRVALENPRRPGYALGVVEVSGAALASSAGNRRRWRTTDQAGQHTHHHLLDGRTGRSGTDILATWVIADTALLADGLATALWFLPAARLRSDGDLDFEYARIHADGRIEADGRFRDAFTLLKRDRP